jgi:precorrin-4 methylase
MATRFHNNWACKAVSKLMRQPSPDKKEVARVLSTQPEFLAAIQEQIDAQKEPGYDPNVPDGDPAQGVIGHLIEALSTPGDMG